MITLSNTHLTVQIATKGAELQSVVDNTTGYEFIWGADPHYWGRHASLLFPNIGKFKDGQFIFEGQTYQMGQHGFARDKEFEIVSQSDEQVVLTLKDTLETRVHYPFTFELTLTYQLVGNQLTWTYRVYNPSSEQTLWYNIGGHPGFNLSVDAQGEFQDATLTFHPAGDYTRYVLNDTLSHVDLSATRSEAVDTIQLQHGLFERDAIIYQLPPYTQVVLQDHAQHMRVVCEQENMAFVGIWSPYPARAPFVCYEPWEGMTDVTTASGQLTEKFHIQHVAPQAQATHRVALTFYKDATHS